MHQIVVEDEMLTRKYVYNCIGAFIRSYGWTTSQLLRELLIVCSQCGMQDPTRNPRGLAEGNQRGSSMFPSRRAWLFAIFVLGQEVDARIPFTCLNCTVMQTPFDTITRPHISKLTLPLSKPASHSWKNPGYAFTTHWRKTTILAHHLLSNDQFTEMPLGWMSTKIQKQAFKVSSSRWFPTTKKARRQWNHLPCNIRIAKPRSHQINHHDQTLMSATIWQNFIFMSSMRVRTMVGKASMLMPRLLILPLGKTLQIRIRLKNHRNYSSIIF